MVVTNIRDLFAQWEFDHKLYLDRVIEIGQSTAIRKLDGIAYRRNYERGLLIMAIIHKHKYQSFLEFGTGRGFSVACALTINPAIRITTIDISSCKQARGLLRHLGFDLSNVQFVSTDSLKSGKHLGKYDFAFVDGSHKYDFVKSDYKTAARHTSGLIVFDDYRNKHLGVKRAVDEIDGTKMLVESDGWLIENVLIEKAGDADVVNAGKEKGSGQIILSPKDFVS